MKRIAVIGASGGIGRAFVDHYARQEDCEAIYAFSRPGMAFGDEKVHPCPLDLGAEDSISFAAKQVDGPLNLVIIASGLLHEDQLVPEKSLQQLTPDALLKVFTVNTIGPALIMKHFLPLLAREKPSVFAALSARVGSISDNRLGGWYSYRASKAALNMLIKSAAIEMRRRNPEAIIAGLHPGTVNTPLSSPFQQRVPEGKLVTPEHAVSQLACVLAGLTARSSGKCFAYDGSEIPP